MALPEESQIMAEIGLGNHHLWYQGSDCLALRRHAADVLPGILTVHGIKPDPDLCRLVADVAESGEKSRYYLTRTWEAASNVIQLSLQYRDGMSPVAYESVKERILTAYPTEVVVDPFGQMIEQPKPLRGRGTL